MDKSITHQAIVQLAEVLRASAPQWSPWKWWRDTEYLQVCFQGLVGVILFFSLQEVNMLKKEIIPLKKKLDPYMDLSPVSLVSDESPGLRPR